MSDELQLVTKWRKLASMMDHGVRKRTLEDCADELEAAQRMPRNLTEHQQAIEKAAGMAIDWGMSNAAVAMLARREKWPSQK
jgi:hypothetical protein